MNFSVPLSQTPFDLETMTANPTLSYKIQLADGHSEMALELTQSYFRSTQTVEEWRG